MYKNEDNNIVLDTQTSKIRKTNKICYYLMSYYFAATLYLTKPIHSQK